MQQDEEEEVDALRVCLPGVYTADVDFGAVQAWLNLKYNYWQVQSVFWWRDIIKLMVVSECKLEL